MADCEPGGTSTPSSICKAINFTDLSPINAIQVADYIGKGDEDDAATTN